MRKSLLIVGLLLCASLARAQGPGNAIMTPTQGAPTQSNCLFNMLWNDTVNGNPYYCKVMTGNPTGTPTLFSTGGAAFGIGGTVTGGTANSVLYVASGPILAQNNANFAWLNGSTSLQVGPRSSQPTDAIGEFYNLSPAKDNLHFHYTGTASATSGSNVVLSSVPNGVALGASGIRLGAWMGAGSVNTADNLGYGTSIENYTTQAWVALGVINGWGSQLVFKTSPNGAASAVTFPGTPTIDSSYASYSAGQRVEFSTSAGGGLPTGFTAGLVYYVISAGLNPGTSFEVSTTPSGSAVAYSASCSGTCYATTTDLATALTLGQDQSASFPGVISSSSTATINTAGNSATATSATSLGNTTTVLDASLQLGADMGVKVSAAWLQQANASYKGGIVTTEGFTGTQAVSNSLFSNTPGPSGANPTFTGTLKLNPGVNIVSSVTQTIPGGIVVDGQSGYVLTTPYGTTGASFQMANGFAGSTPLIQYASGWQSGSNYGTRLKNLGIGCLTPNSTFVSGSIGIQDLYTQENSGGDYLRILGCDIGIDIEGGTNGARNGGPWNNTQISMPGITDTGAKCVQYGSTTTSTISNRGFHGGTCVGGGTGATAQPLVGFAIDGQSFTVDDYHIEDFVTDFEIGANHTVASVTLSNINASAVMTSPTTTVIDLASYGTKEVAIIGLLGNSNYITNMIVDHGTNGYTIPYSAHSYIQFYVRDGNCVMTSLPDFPTRGCNFQDNTASTNDVDYKDDFKIGYANAAAVYGELQWSARTVGTAPTYTQLNGAYPNLGLLQITTGSGNSGIGGGLDWDNNYASPLGPIGAYAGWDHNWIFELTTDTLQRFRTGFYEANGSAHCGSAQVTSITASCDGMWVRADTHAPAQSTVAADNPTCSLAGACRNAGGTVATFLTSGAHGMDMVGQTVTIAGVTDTSFDSGTSSPANCVVSAIPDTTHFSCPNTGTGSAHSGTGTATPVANANYQVETKNGTLTSSVWDTGVPLDTSIFHKFHVNSVTAGTLLVTPYAQIPIATDGITRASGVATVTTTVNNYAYTGGTAQIALTTGCATVVNNTPQTFWTVTGSATTTFTFNQVGGDETCGGSSGYVVVQQTATASISSNISSNNMQPFVQMVNDTSATKGVVLDFFRFKLPLIR